MNEIFSPPGILRSTEGEAAVVATVPTEGVVSSPELARHLLIGGSAPGYQDYVETCQPAYGEEDQGYDAHHYHRDDRNNLQQDRGEWREVDG